MSNDKGRRTLSRDAEEWFNDTHRVVITRGEFVITNRATNKAVGRCKYEGVMLYARDAYGQHCRHRIEEART